MSELRHADIDALIAERHQLNHLLSGIIVDEEVAAPNIRSRIIDVDAELQPTYQPALQRLVTLDYPQFVEQGTQLAFDYGRPELLRDITFAGKLSVGKIIMRTPLELEQIKRVAGKPNIEVSPDLGDELDVGFLIWTDDYNGFYPTEGSVPSTAVARRRSTTVGKRAILSMLAQAEAKLDSNTLDFPVDPFVFLRPLAEAYSRLGEFDKAKKPLNHLRYVATNIADSLTREFPNPEDTDRRAPLALNFLKEHFPDDFNRIYDRYAAAFDLQARPLQALSIATDMAAAESRAFYDANEPGREQMIRQQLKDLRARKDVLDLQSL